MMKERRVERENLAKTLAPIIANEFGKALAQLFGG